MRRQTFFVAASVLAMAIATPALAQSVESLPIGSTVQGEITEGDATAAEDAYRYDDYRIRARAGQRLEAVMRSDAFDAYLEVFHMGEDESLASDDDGLGEGTDSRLRFTASRGGSYLLRARTLWGVEGGAYTLTLNQRPAAGRPPRPSVIRVGQSVEGALEARDPESDSGHPYDAYSFRARAGERFAIDLMSDEFDPVVRVGRMQAGAFVELAMNDDTPATGLNSRLVFTAGDSGDYIIRATPLVQGGEGAYTLALARGPEIAAAQPIEIGGSFEGALTEDDATGVAGSTADSYRFSGREGQRIRVEMSSEEFDTYLELFDTDQVSLAQDDDGAEGTNSRLTFTLPRTGTYLIEARAFTEATGAYSLAVTEVEPEKAPEPLSFGSTIQGEIEAADSLDDQNRGFDAYAVQGVAGQRIQAIMRSGDFDTYLQIGRGAAEFEVLAFDDDGLGEGFDSRLNFILPEDGEYILRALPLGAGEEGLYSLELIDRGPQPQPGSVLVGATARGVLTENDAIAENNSFYDAYRVTLREDEKLVITMVSNEVDSLVTIGRAQADGAFEALGSDDDGLSDTHARLEWTAPADGVYEIHAGTFQQGQTGAYALNVEKQP
jgi:hypothetical protein